MKPPIGPFDFGAQPSVLVFGGVVLVAVVDSVAAVFANGGGGEGAGSGGKGRGSGVGIR